ncbi:protein SORF3 [Spheniscid alphaherpesvirus 1]|uniref:Protein SORF3 n=1 Tax=Spheniscid alphaherpesvirus 1 TaxID=2560777 RepID=A0A1R3TCX9_9ALPH|nr:protein SORF3 [Spheniscid alphaherpesvirus 1]SCO83630.1 protein SORF3 [Spheniscid alphaherpesvirus 1]
MDRIFIGTFSGLDIPRGRFWQPKTSSYNIMFWSNLIDDMLNAARQCSEARERIASIKIGERPEDCPHDPYLDIWAQAAIWAVYRVCKEIDDRFSVEELSTLAKEGLTAGDQWKLFPHKWDFRDVAKMPLLGSSILLLFTCNLEICTAGLIEARRYDVMWKGGNGGIVSTTAKHAVLSVLEVARFVLALTLPLCDHRIPPGIPHDDNPGRAIRLCASMMQQNLISRDDEDPPDAQLDGEEQYFRSLFALTEFSNCTININDTTSRKIPSFFQSSIPHSIINQLPSRSRPAVPTVRYHPRSSFEICNRCERPFPVQSNPQTVVTQGCSFEPVYEGIRRLDTRYPHARLHVAAPRLHMRAPCTRMHQLKVVDIYNRPKRQ